MALSHSVCFSIVLATACLPSIGCTANKGCWSWWRLFNYITEHSNHKLTFVVITLYINKWIKVSNEKAACPQRPAVGWACSYQRKSHGKAHARAYTHPRTHTRRKYAQRKFSPSLLTSRTLHANVLNKKKKTAICLNKQDDWSWNFRVHPSV